MLTKIEIRNFKRFKEVSIELGNPVVFVGPNNSGKTTALQALALWDLGLRRLIENKTSSKTATINRLDLIALPVPTSDLLWQNRALQRLIEIDVKGVTGSESWECRLVFDRENEESILVWPQAEIPANAGQSRIAFLPPMSGLTANETRLDMGAINVRLGEGRTAEILRNVCYLIASSDEKGWQSLQARMHVLFQVDLTAPQYLPGRGEIWMSYRDLSGTELDLSAAGRGLQQTLLLLAHLTLNPGAVLLIDEPDAHLEILRQRQIYQVLSDAAREHGSQVIMASHSEVILNEAADRDVVVAFVGKPHRIDDRGAQVLKSLKEIGFDQYYQAEQSGWVLYLEGSTDLAILRAFAKLLRHPAQVALEKPFVRYVENKPGAARDHFYGLRAAKPDLQGFALFDRLDFSLDRNPHLEQRMWRRREIENYLCYPEALLDWARQQAGGGAWEIQMEAAIRQIESAMLTLGKGSPWSENTKVSDDFLNPLFEHFYRSLGLPNLMRKTDYHQLAPHVPNNRIDPEVFEVLDRILDTFNRATPAGDPNTAS